MARRQQGRGSAAGAAVPALRRPLPVPWRGARARARLAARDGGALARRDPERPDEGSLGVARPRAPHGAHGASPPLPNRSAQCPVRHTAAHPGRRAAGARPRPREHAMPLRKPAAQDCARNRRAPRALGPGTRKILARMDLTTPKTRRREDQGTERCCKLLAGRSSTCGLIPCHMGMKPVQMPPKCVAVEPYQPWSTSPAENVRGAWSAKCLGERGARLGRDCSVAAGLLFQPFLFGRVRFSVTAHTRRQGGRSLALSPTETTQRPGRRPKQQAWC